MHSEPFGRIERARAAIILAGGQSSRYGSNKAFQTLADQPLIRRVADRVSRVVGEVVVVIGRDEPRGEYHKVLPNGVKLVNDELKGKNPLIGIIAGLTAIEADYAAILPCDAAFVSSKVVELLFQRALCADAAIPRWNDQSVEPLQAVYRRASTLEATRHTLTPADLSIEDMIRRLDRIVYVPVEGEIARIDPDLATFFNINTREDMKVAESMVAEKRFEGPSLSGTE